jgi:predicted transcriptional regulator
MSTEDYGPNNSQIYSIERRKKEIVCEFLNQVEHNKSQNLKDIIKKYNGNYYRIKNTIESLNTQQTMVTKKLNSFFSFRQSSKDRHNNSLIDLREQINNATADEQTIDNFYNEYVNYLSTIPEMESNKWKIDQHKLSKSNFFAELNNCIISIPAGNDMSTSNLVDGGRKSRKSRKSNKKGKSRKSKKSRKSNKKGKSRKYRK